jgi:lysophospholipase L1-like esterase
MSQVLVLLGDSILDNASYTFPKPDTTSHLERLLGPEWSILRLAQDGATMADVGAQLHRFEEQSAAAVLSIGGNDALQHVGLFERSASTSSEVLAELLLIAEDFGRAYETVAREVVARFKRTVICTIYEVQLEPREYARLARVPLAVLNDRIVRIGSKLGADVLDLRSVCTEPSDFVLQIEPSASGAAKIAEAIAAVLENKSTVKAARMYSA